MCVNQCEKGRLSSRIELDAVRNCTDAKRSGSPHVRRKNEYAGLPAGSIVLNRSGHMQPLSDGTQCGVHHVQPRPVLNVRYPVYL